MSINVIIMSLNGIITNVNEWHNHLQDYIHWHGSRLLRITFPYPFHVQLAAPTVSGAEHTRAIQLIWSLCSKQYSNVSIATKIIKNILHDEGLKLQCTKVDVLWCSYKLPIKIGAAINCILDLLLGHEQTPGLISGIDTIDLDLPAINQVVKVMKAELLEKMQWLIFRKCSVTNLFTNL